MKSSDVSWHDYQRVHSWMLYHHPKTGRCENCGEMKRTQWALLHGKTYEKARDNFLELCSKCHRIYDNTPDWSANIAKGKIGNTHRKGKTFSEASRRKISEAKRGVPRPDVAERNRIIKRKIPLLKV